MVRIPGARLVSIILGMKLAGGLLVRNEGTTVYPATGIPAPAGPNLLSR